MNWKTMPLSHKIAVVISVIAVVIWLLPKMKPGILPFDPTYPAIALFTLCEAVLCWKEKRTFSYLLIGAAIICLACCILECI